MKNLARKWCQKLYTFLFEVTFTFGKMCLVNSYCRGINPLEKSELSKVMSDRRQKQNALERRKEIEVEQTPFQKMIQDRAKRMERIEQAAAHGATGVITRPFYFT